MRRTTGWIVVGALALTLCACATQTAKSSNSAAPAVAKGVAASSPLAKVQLGMSKKQVKNLIGSPSDENSYSTGKAWIPFYYGNDARRTTYYYKGMGRVVFADGNIFGGGNSEVTRVDYDPTESGTAR